MTNKSDSTDKINKQGVAFKTLYLINDDFNSFDHVIDCLVAICDHSPIQAEQSALLTHYKGRCDILNGELENLEPIKEDLLLYGLYVEIV
jgi:ATP-dependent Clp protease adaptor protein ClpS